MGTGSAGAEGIALISFIGTCSGMVEETATNFSYGAYPNFSTLIGTDLPSSTPFAKFTMNEPSISVVVSELARFPMMVTLAPSTGRRDCLSVTIPDIVIFFAWARPNEGSASTTIRKTALIRRLIIYAVAGLGSPQGARHWYRAVESRSCLRAGERAFPHLHEDQS